MTIHQAIKIMEAEGMKELGFYRDFKGIIPVYSKHFMSIEEAKNLFNENSTEIATGLYIGTWFNRGESADTREEKYWRPDVGVICYKEGAKK